MIDADDDDDDGHCLKKRCVKDFLCFRVINHHDPLCVHRARSSTMARMEPDDAWSVIESLLALDLNKMSLNEGEKVFEDLHGVSGVVDTSPELVVSCLDELELKAAKTRRRDACVAAASEDSS
jgi:hypothetical protein